MDKQRNSHRWVSITMKLKYKIIEVHPDQHSIVVRFYTDEISEEKLVSQFNEDGSPLMTSEGNIARCRTDYSINIWKVPAPEGQELHDTIVRGAPVDWLKLQGLILDDSVDTSMNHIHALKHQEFEHEIKPVEPNFMPIFKTRESEFPGVGVEEF